MKKEEDKEGIQLQKITWGSQQGRIRKEGIGDICPGPLFKESTIVCRNGKIIYR